MWLQHSGKTAQTAGKGRTGFGGLGKMLDFIPNAKESQWIIFKGGGEEWHKQTDVIYFVEKIVVIGQE